MCVIPAGSRRRLFVRRMFTHLNSPEPNEFFLAPVRVSSKSYKLCGNIVCVHSHRRNHCLPRPHRNEFSHRALCLGPNIHKTKHALLKSCIEKIYIHFSNISKDMGISVLVTVLRLNTTIAGSNLFHKFINLFNKNRVSYF